MPDIASLEAQAVAALEARQEALRRLNASYPPGDPEYLAGLRARKGRPSHQLGEPIEQRMQPSRRGPGCCDKNSMFERQ
jgi:hypothetical protein